MPPCSTHLPPAPAPLVFLAQVPEGIYPGWRTRITSGHRHADKAWLMWCPCGERMSADRASVAAERVLRHIKGCDAVGGGGRAKGS